MLFSELYGAYYNAVAKILSVAVKGELNEKEMRRIVDKYAFSESTLSILPALKEEKWQLVTRDLQTPMMHEPTLPLTLLQKRWLKAITLDPRVRLFGIPTDGLEDVEPLFTSADCYVFDSYADGDDYESETYIQLFRRILDAVKNRYPLKLEVENRNGDLVQMNVIPEYIEYSEKDDKFRLITSGCGYAPTVNIGRVRSCKRYYGGNIQVRGSLPKKPNRIVLELTDARNALERVLLHFAHFEKQAERLGENKYRVTILYDQDDETELVIRVLSFGPFVKAIEPERFVNLIRERLIKQKSCGL